MPTPNTQEAATLHYKPAKYMALTWALLDYWTMLENGHWLEASQIQTWIVIAQCKRAEVGEVMKTRHFIEPALERHELSEARDDAKASRAPKTLIKWIKENMT